MQRTMNRVRWMLASTGLAIAPLLSGCDVKNELLAPQNPGVIDPASVNSPAAAQALRVAAQGQLKSRTAGTESMWMYGGLLTDEWKSSDTFSQRNETDQRSIQTSNANIRDAYNPLQQARGYTQTAIQKSFEFTPENTAEIGRMYFTLGFLEMELAENFCNGIPLTYTVNGIPNYGQPLTNDSVYKQAIVHFDSALALAGTATDTASVTVRRIAQIGKARALVNIGQQAPAPALVSSANVPTNFQYLLTFDQTTQDQQLWSLNTSAGRYTVSDSIDNITGIIPNAIPFVSAKDPRVPTSTTTVKPFDGVTPLLVQKVYPNRSDAIPLVSGIDARLIEAESKMAAGDFAGMMTILNALRTSQQTLGTVLVVPAMPALTTTPTTKDQAVNVLFREWAFWTFGRGQRLPNLRREIRLYGKTQEQIFPIGNFHKTGQFGSDVNFPVPDAELTNPNFKGCIDRKA
jgi:starch-binding outer membrane protein, SusD/RagB family